MRATSGTAASTQNLKALSVFRVAFAAYLIGDFLANDILYFSDFYGREGILPTFELFRRESASLPSLLACPFAMLEQPLATAILELLYLCALLGLFLGFRTRICNVIVLAIKVYLNTRNPDLVSGIEDLSRLLLIWSLFLPLNNYWSIDAVLDPRLSNRRWSILPFLAVRVQVCSIYVFAALFKLQGEAWRNGSAVSWVLRDNVFGGTYAGAVLLDHYAHLVQFLTFAVLALQLSFSLLIFCPWRNNATRLLALAATASMHIAFIVFLNVGGFPYVCLTMLLLLVPDEWIDCILRRGRESCQFLLRHLPSSLWKLLTPSLVIALPVTVDARVLKPAKARLWKLGGNALLAEAPAPWRSLFASPLGTSADASLPSRIREAPEQVVTPLDASQRRASRTVPTTSPTRELSQASVALCFALSTLALFCNVSGVSEPWLGKWSLIERLSRVALVQQRWELFAPIPAHAHREIRIDAVLQSGEWTDAMTALPSALVRSSREGAMLQFANFRWRKYFAGYQDHNENKWAALGSYLCRRLNNARVGIARPIQFVVVSITVEPARSTGQSFERKQTRQVTECQSVTGRV